MTPECECPVCSKNEDPTDAVFDLCRAKKFDDAAEVCRSKIAADPQGASGYGLMASVLELAGKHREALPYRDREVALSQNSTMSYFSRALLHYRLGNYTAAIPDFTRSAELDREQAIGPANYLYRADCHRHLGNFDRAIGDCSLVPDDFDFPGFLDQWEGTKHHLLAEIERERSGTDTKDEP